jgi:hypothetical protein
MMMMIMMMSISAMDDKHDKHNGEQERNRATKQRGNMAREQESKRAR